ncbi:MAG: CocE/NonD family hydrolase, partial [Desulfobacterales bacterium]
QMLLSYGYAIVAVDMRGCGASYGWMADFMLQICDDGKQLVDWIAGQSWCDGNVGMSGGSYLGWSQLCVAQHAPEALKCIIPAVVPLEGFTGEVYPGGIYGYAFMQLWSGGMYFALRNWHIPGLVDPTAPVIDEDQDGQLVDEIPIDQNGNGTFLDDFPPQYPDGLARQRHYYYLATLSHAAHPGGAPGNYDYDKWASQAFFIDAQRPVDGATAPDLCANFIPAIMDSKIPIYHVGGWFDGFARGSFELYSTMKNTNPSRILMRPSYHGPVSPGFAELFEIDIDEYEMGLNIEALRWYDRWLKGIANGIDDEDPILIYVMNGKGWRQEKSWPLPRQRMHRYYFKKRNRLSKIKPCTVMTDRSDDYVADFTHNSGWEPELDVSWLNIVSLLLRKKLPVTNSFYANRYLALAGPAPTGLPIRTELDDKCLTYTSKPMARDTEVTGHPIIHLWVSSTADYGDLYFYLEDVDQNGEAILISEYPLRAGFAALHDNDEIITTGDDVDVLPDLPWHGYAEADYIDGIFADDNIVEIVNDLHPTSWVFKEGHRIRVSIACADWPTFRLHPDLCPSNKPHRCLVNPIITVYRDANFSSYIELPVVTR